ncbi:MAG: hypothetical protein EOO94_01800 [Pedobacter sp.]|nr:MAG: hypothetical protein EOO94_01800 [Pedobacter sp.]
MYMPVLIQYLVKLSVSLAVVFLFYRFILRPLTFYTWNRWYLLCYSAIAFVIPFVDINPFLSKAAIAESDVISFIPVIDPRSLQGEHWFNLNNSWNQVLLIFLAGILVLVIRLLTQLSGYLRLKNSSRLLSENPVKLYQVDKDIVPFSFGNSIFVNQEQHDNTELQEIIRHEFIHVKQKHTADMIWAEILCILNWYNPFAWMIKKVIRQNLEFIADQQVLENGLDRKQYQYLLLKVAGGASFRITNQFNFSFLKKRIAMMNKMKSARLHLLKFAFVLPLIAVLLLSFRDDIENLIIVESTPMPAGADTTPLIRLTLTEKKHLTETGLKSGKDSLEAVAVFSADDGQKVFGGESRFQALREVRVHQDTLPIFDPANKTPPLFFVDEIIRSGSYVSSLEPEDIDRVEVLKGASAQQYGEKGQYGVVRIYLKKDRDAVTRISPDKKKPAKKEALQEITIRADSTRQPYGLVITSDSMTIDASNTKVYGGSSQFILRGVGKAGREPLYVIDGVRQPKNSNALQDLKGEDIESLSVLKDASATSLFGEDAINGVIIIVTKKDKSDKVLKERDSVDGKPVNTHTLKLKVQSVNN